MKGRRGLALTLAATLGLCGPAGGQLSVPVDEWQRDWTVVTMAPDGAWGVATDMYVIKALAGAVDDCLARTRRDVGCGSHFTTIRAGWTLGFRCGGRNIISAEAKLDDAVKRASWREFELRRLHDPDMPHCVRVVTVDPAGKILAPAPDGAADRSP